MYSFLVIVIRRVVPFKKNTLVGCESHEVLSERIFFNFYRSSVARLVSLKNNVNILQIVQVQKIFLCFVYTIIYIKTEKLFALKILPPFICLRNSNQLYAALLDFLTIEFVF